LRCSQPSGDRYARNSSSIGAFSSKAFVALSKYNVFHNISLVAQTGLQFDLTTSQGKLMESLMFALAEFEGDLLRERVRSGVAAAQARGVVFSRCSGQRVKSDHLTLKVLELVEAGHSYRQIGRLVNLSKNTVLDIVKRNRSDIP
jgi:putative DNA-invertase from lambdoid prophage Rac